MKRLVHLGRAIGVATFMLSALLSQGTAAHTLADVQEQMFERDQYFQVRNEAVEDFALADADGNPVSLSDFRGKVVILNFIYTSCLDVCPLHSEKIAEVQDLVALSPMAERLQFVSVTTDPSRDTGDILRSYGPVHGLDPVNWAFLTSAAGGPEATTREIAQRFGIEFTPGDDGMLMHGVATIVIDPQGQWRGTFHGLDFPAVDLVVFANALSNSDHAHDEPVSIASPVPWIPAAIGLTLIGLAVGGFLAVRRSSGDRVKETKR